MDNHWERSSSRSRRNLAAGGVLTSGLVVTPHSDYGDHVGRVTKSKTTVVTSHSDYGDPVGRVTKSKTTVVTPHTDYGDPVGKEEGRTKSFSISAGRGHVFPSEPRGVPAAHEQECQVWRRPTPSEAAALSPPQRRARAARHPFGRPAARRTALAPVRPTPIRVQQAHPVARQAVPRPPPVQPTRQAAPAPQRRQPVVTPPIVPAEVARARVSPPPSSSRKRSAQAELFSLSTHQVSAFARLSHYKIVRQTPTPPVPVVPVPAVVPQAVGSDLPSSSTSGLGRRARRNRNQRLRLAASEVERQ
ncbi:hypothetical protein M5K25_013127 [Dendrobium thyrsiflorum]|uniref:Uncharacterized protein n=1 Tax=Dendrobium thyrsiflorum TaxID=117978 RepID=A0ABD0UZ04_DENTH